MKILTKEQINFIKSKFETEEKMSVVQETEVKWTPDQMVEVLLREPDDFLKVRETLTRIGVASRKEKRFIRVSYSS